MNRSVAKGNRHSAVFRVLEGERAGERLSFVRGSKDGEKGWQEQTSVKEWFISDDQMRIWVELGCIEKAG